MEIRKAKVKKKGVTSRATCFQEVKKTEQDNGLGNLEATDDLQGVFPYRGKRSYIESIT